MIMTSVVENPPTPDSRVPGSNPDPEVEIGPTTSRNRRRVVFTPQQDDNNDTPTFFESLSDMSYKGTLIYLNCSSQRMLFNYTARVAVGDLYWLQVAPIIKKTVKEATGALRVRTLLTCTAVNGEMLYIRDHMHYSVLTARPILWRSLMLLVNEKYPGMYTPPDKPLISSYKFGIPRDLLEEHQLKINFPCLRDVIGTVDKSCNNWLSKCPGCRHRGRSLDLWKHDHKLFYKRIERLRARITELRARDMAMKWAYLGRRLVCGI